jgi:protein transport protein SEC24
VPVVNFVGTIVRCRRCRTYINAYVMFTDGGRRWRCNVCSLLNEGGLQVNCEVCRFGEEWKGGAEFLDVTSW